MANVWTELTQGADTTNNPATTASITPSSGSVVYVGAALAVIGGDAPVAGDIFACSGCGLTWTLVKRQTLGTRREAVVFRGTGTPSTGTLTLTYTPTSAQTFTEWMWSVDEVAGADSGTPNDAAVSSAIAGNTALNLVDVGTPGADDHIYSFFVVTGAAASVVIPDGTALTNLGGGSDCRTVVAFYDADHSDETPGITWTGTEDAGGISFIVNAAAGGGGATTEPGWYGHTGWW